MDETEKNKIKANFQKKINQQLTGGIDTTAAQYGATNIHADTSGFVSVGGAGRSNSSLGGVSDGGGSGGPQAGRLSIQTKEGRQVSGSIAQVINDATVDNANEIVSQMGFIQKTEPKKTGKQTTNTNPVPKVSDTQIFNMNNYGKLNSLQKSDKSKVYDIITHYIAKSNEVSVAQLCNCGIDDDFVVVLMNKLKEASKNPDFALQEIWLENNRIRDKGKWNKY